jgi:hypothetical protein
LIVPRMKKELGHGEWDNTIDMWNFWPRVQRILYSPCNDNELYLGLMAPAADPRGSRVPIDFEVWVEMFPFLSLAWSKQRSWRRHATTDTKQRSSTAGREARSRSSATPRMEWPRRWLKGRVARWSTPSACRRTWRRIRRSKTPGCLGTSHTPAHRPYPGPVGPVCGQPLAFKGKHVHAGRTASCPLRPAAPRLLMAAIVSGAQQLRSPRG